MKGTQTNALTAIVWDEGSRSESSVRFFIREVKVIYPIESSQIGPTTTEGATAQQKGNTPH